MRMMRFMKTNPMPTASVAILPPYVFSGAYALRAAPQVPTCGSNTPAIEGTFRPPRVETLPKTGGNKSSRADRGPWRLGAAVSDDKRKTPAGKAGVLRLVS
jgi:hypothetical protein